MALRTRMDLMFVRYIEDCVRSAEQSARSIPYADEKKILEHLDPLKMTLAAISADYLKARTKKIFNIAKG